MIRRTQSPELHLTWSDLCPTRSELEHPPITLPSLTELFAGSVDQNYRRRLVSDVDLPKRVLVTHDGVQGAEVAYSDLQELLFATNNGHVDPNLFAIGRAHRVAFEVGLVWGLNGSEAKNFVQARKIGRTMVTEEVQSYGADYPNATLQQANLYCALMLQSAYVIGRKASVFAEVSYEGVEE